MAIHYRVYGNGGVGGAPIDYSTVLATVSGTSWVTPALALGSNWLFGVRAFDTVSGLEELNTDATTRVIVDGNGADASGRPGSPLAIAADPQANGTVLVTWTFLPTPGLALPSLFKIWLSSAGTFLSPRYWTPHYWAPSWWSGKFWLSAGAASVPGGAYFSDRFYASRYFAPVYLSHVVAAGPPTSGGAYFGTSYFARSYFAPVYWPHGFVSTAPPVVNFGTVPAATVPYQATVVNYGVTLSGLTDRQLYAIGVRASNGFDDPNVTNTLVLGLAAGPEAVQLLTATATFQE